MPSTERIKNTAMLRQSPRFSKAVGIFCCVVQGSCWTNSIVSICVFYTKVFGGPPDPARFFQSPTFPPASRFFGTLSNLYVLSPTLLLASQNATCRQPFRCCPLRPVYLPSARLFRSRRTLPRPLVFFFPYPSGLFYGRRSFVEDPFETLEYLFTLSGSYPGHKKLPQTAVVSLGLPAQGKHRYHPTLKLTRIQPFAPSGRSFLVLISSNNIVTDHHTGNGMHNETLTARPCCNQRMRDDARNLWMDIFTPAASSLEAFARFPCAS